ncbi:MAG: site-specific integrase [Candidatus Eremiobacteraeota bacterium]|nr:site-specific integrase [Candidatus Eremiobacteraeota bacterium]MCW5869260.1 site-specific integrase [Candidatus Eremiobacteraeota bacterium]
MAIDRRGPQRYRIRLPLGYDGGKRVVLTETVHGTKREAEARHRDLQSELERGNLTRRSKRSLNEFLTEWLATAQGRLSERTHEEYCGLVGRYIKLKLGRHSLDKLTAFSIQQFYNDLLRKGLSARTVRTVHTVLSQALKAAVKLKMVPINPSRDVELPKHKQRRVLRAMDVDQARKFILASHVHLCGAVFRTAIELGLRPQEYCALEWSDLNWETGEMMVDKAMTWPKGGGWRIKAPKTELSRRKVVLSPTLLEDLRRHRTRQVELKLLMGPEWEDAGDFIFTNTFGRPLTVWTLNYNYKAILKEAGLAETFRVYDLRHSAATLMLAGNTPPKVAADRLGHSTIRLTMDTYSHVMPSMQQEVASKFESLLHGVQGHALDTEQVQPTPAKLHRIVGKAR